MHRCGKGSVTQKHPIAHPASAVHSAKQTVSARGAGHAFDAPSQRGRAQATHSWLQEQPSSSAAARGLSQAEKRLHFRRASRAHSAGQCVLRAHTSAVGSPSASACANASEGALTASAISGAAAVTRSGTRSGSVAAWAPYIRASSVARASMRTACASAQEYAQTRLTLCNIRAATRLKYTLGMELQSHAM